MSSRRKPRRGPKPSPCRRTASTAAPQSTRIPRSRGSRSQLWEPTRKVTGTAASSSARRWRIARAWRGVFPATSTPAIRTPPASRDGEPAKTRPRTTATSTATAPRMSVRCQSMRRWARVLGRRRDRTRKDGRRLGKARSLAAGLAVFASQVRGDDLPLDLRGSLNDLEHLCVAHPLLDGVVAHDSGAAEDLDGVRRDIHGGVGGKRLRVRAEQSRVLSGVEGGAGAPDEEARRRDLYRHVRHLEAHALAAEDWPAEGLPLQGVSARMHEGGARDADRAGGHLRPRGLEEVERDLEALPLAPHEPVGRDPRVVEQQRSRVRRPQSQLAFFATGLDARILALDEEGRDFAIELREDEGDVGDATVRDVHLLSLEDVVVTV